MDAIFFEKPIDTNFLGHQFAEVYKDRVYMPFVEGKNLNTILDIGANVGVTAYYFAQHAKKVIAVEPSLEHFDCLMKMVEFNKLENVTPVNKAIFFKAGKFPLWHPDNKTSRSLHQGVMAPNDPNPQSEEVTAVTLPQLFADNSIEHVDLMKLDIEGSEVEVICSTSFKEVAPKIDTIIMELHSWNGRNPNQLLDGLKDAGFVNIQPIQLAPGDASILVATK